MNRENREKREREKVNEGKKGKGEWNSGANWFVSCL